MRCNYTKSSVIFFLFSLGALIFPTLAMAGGPPEPTLLESGSKGLTLDWQLPAYALDVNLIEGKQYSLVTIPGLSLSEQSGHPQLPFYNALIGLPPTGGVSLRISNVEKETIQLKHPIQPASIPSIPLPTDWPQVENGDLTTLYSIQLNETIYATKAFYPAAIAQLSEIQQIRRQRVARLTINPVQVNPVTGQAIIIRSLKLKITFEQPLRQTQAGPADKASKQVKSDPFSRVLANTLLNPESLEWQTEILPSPHQEGVRERASVTPPYKIIVAEAGLYALTYADLQQAGLPLDTLDPGALQLSHGVERQQIAIQVEGEGDGSFDEGDRILFYAFPDFSRYTDEIVYFLSYEDGPGARMGTRPGDPDGLASGTPWVTVAAEEDNKYDPFFAARNGDHWYWTSLSIDGARSATFTLPLTDPLATDKARLTLYFHGRTNNDTHNPDHRVAVSFNSASLGEVSWDSNTAPLTGALSVPATALQNGDNEITLSLPGVNNGGGNIAEEAWFDAMSLTYPRSQAASGQHWFNGEAGQKAYTIESVPASSVAVYDITRPVSPQIVTGFTLDSARLTIGDANASTADYLIVPAGQVKSPLTITPTNIISDPPGGAKYIIITHPDFAAAVAPLAAHRAAMTGTKAVTPVITVSVSAIYDTFGDGRMDAAAIKSYLQHAWNTWTPAKPIYVVLVGDGHYDFKDHQGWGNPNFIPPYLAKVDLWLSGAANDGLIAETASDNLLAVLVDGDHLPEVMIGRLPVNSVAEAETVVDKIIHYETDPPAGEWNVRHLFVTAQPEAGIDGKTVYFNENADQAYDLLLRPPFLGYRYYYTPANNAALPYLYTEVKDLRQDFFSRYNLGVGMVVYHGHSWYHAWASELDKPEAILQWSANSELNDVNQLNNGYRLPIMLEMTCATGQFHNAEYPTLDESLLRHSGGGAVALWGATGYGFTRGHDKLQKGFYETAFNNKGAIPDSPKLGAAVFGGQLKLYLSGQDRDLLDTFTLFGDPAMTINLEFTPFLNPEAGSLDENWVVDFPEAILTDTIHFTVTPSISFTVSFRLRSRQAWASTARMTRQEGYNRAIIKHEPLQARKSYTLTLLPGAKTVSGGEIASKAFNIMLRKIYLPILTKE